jgi:capsular polysaccharide biosynthesis protein
MTGAWNPYGFNWLREKFAPFCRPAATGQAIFLTRRSAARLPSCLPEIEDTFTKNGFMIVDCANLSVREQMRLASSAPAIAGLHGAAMTNLLWAQPGTPVLEIFSPNWLNAVYEQIALHGGLDYSVHIIEQDTCTSFFDRWCHSAGS